MVLSLKILPQVCSASFLLFGSGSLQVSLLYFIEEVPFSPNTTWSSGLKSIVPSATRSSVHSTILFGNKSSPSLLPFPPIPLGLQLRLEWAQAEAETEDGRRVGWVVERKVEEEEEVGRGGRVGRERKVEVEGVEEDRRKSGLVVLLGRKTPRMR